jgi:hypothetical protein
MERDFWKENCRRGPIAVGEVGEQNADKAEDRGISFVAAAPWPDGLNGVVSNRCAGRRLPETVHTLLCLKLAMASANFSDSGAGKQFLQHSAQIACKIVLALLPSTNASDELERVSAQLPRRNRPPSTPPWLLGAGLWMTPRQGLTQLCSHLVVAAKNNCSTFSRYSQHVVDWRMLHLGTYTCHTGWPRNSQKQLGSYISNDIDGS